MKASFSLISTLLLVLLLPQTTYSHHSVYADFDIEGSITIEGVVTEVWFKSPHIRVDISVTDKAGKNVMWNTYGHNPTALRRQGWVKDTLKAGDKVVASGDPTFNGSPKMFLRKVSIEGGKVLLNKAGGPG